jgi:hypothetical protein
VHRDDDPVGVIGMPKDVMASFDPIELPAAALPRGGPPDAGVTAGSRCITRRR